MAAQRKAKLFGADMRGFAMGDCLGDIRVLSAESGAGLGCVWGILNHPPARLGRAGWRAGKGTKGKRKAVSFQRSAVSFLLIAERLLLIADG